MNQLVLKKKNELMKKKKGFTLVELIIVIAIIAILAAMAIPKFGQVRQDAKVSNDIATAKNIQTTTAMLIGNGTIQESEFASKKAVTTEITNRIDGKTVPTADNVTTKTFMVKVEDGNVIVTVDDYQLAPQLDTDVADGNKATSGYGKKVE